jgi:hypothetical protein
MYPAVGFWLSGFFGFWSLQDIMQVGRAVEK